MKEIIRKQSSLIFVIVVMLALTACGKKETRETSKTSNLSQKESVTTDPEAQSGFDMENVINNITFNGKKVEFPLSIENLGEEYSLSDNIVAYGNNNECVAEIVYKDFRIASIVTRAESIEEINNSTKFYQINIDYTFDAKIEVCGVSTGDNIEKVIENFGEPTEKYGEDSTDNHEIYEYARDEDNMVSFSFESGKCRSIIIIYDKGE